MPNLLPEGYEEEIITEEDLTQRGPIGYKNGVAFNDEAGDFKRDGKGKILDSTGLQSWESWCVNCIRTERYKHAAYGTDFGIELDAAFAATTRQEAESILTRQITEALLADPYGRTDYIEEITFNWTAPDTVSVGVTVHGIDDITIDITAYLTKTSA